MKTTLNIPEDRLTSLLEITHAKTRTEAVNKAIDEFIRREKLRRVLELAGTMDDFLTHDELSKVRKTE